MTKNIRIGVGLIASIAVILSAAAWAHTAGVFAPPTAVAIVDISALWNGLDERQALMDELQAKYKPMQDELVKMQAEYQSNLQRLEEEGPTMTRDEFQSLDMATLLLRQQRINTQELLAFAQDTGIHAIMQDLSPKMFDGVNRVAQRDGWDIVLLDTNKVDLTRARDLKELEQAVFSKHILYANPNVDITSEVLLLLNNEYANRQAPPVPPAIP